MPSLTRRLSAEALGTFGLVFVGSAVVVVNGGFPNSGIGLIGILAWLIALPVLAFVSGVLPSTVGWTAIGVLLLIVVEAVVAMVMMGPLVAVASVALLAVMSAWLWTVSTTLLAQPVA